MKDFSDTKVAQILKNRWANKDMEKYLNDKAIDFKNKLLSDKK